MSDVLSIQVVFCGPNGETKDGPLIIPSGEPPRRFDDEGWDKDRSVRVFRTFLQRRDGDGTEAAMRALDRLNCWHEALKQLMTDPGPNEGLGADLLWLWISYGFHVARSLKGDLILVDVFKHLLPPYGGAALTLYRGELNSRHRDRTYGISWTPDLRVARMFADRRYPDEGTGVVLKTDALPEMIVVSPGGHSSYLSEEEYIIDPRLIREICVIP